MPTTRSSTRSIANAAVEQSNASTDSERKRKAISSPAKRSSKKTRAANVVPPPPPMMSLTPVTEAPTVTATEIVNTSASDADLVPAELSFSFEEAKRHLIGVDRRFSDLFNKMECKPYQQLEQLHPFRALVTSILGQQISWKVARLIKHRFIRLYDPSLPENLEEYHPDTAPVAFFPTPQQVANTDLVTLRSAGLTMRKTEYIQDLAMRFADGRLSTEKLINADDDELARMLTEVRGIGRWTVDMFAIFSLRRPNILPVGDLGVQRGLLLWFLSLHSPLHPCGLSPEKLGTAVAKTSIKSGAKASTKASAKKKAQKKTTAQEDDDVLPVFGGASMALNKLPEKAFSDQDDVVPTSVSPIQQPEALLDIAQDKGVIDGAETASIPSPFTPSIMKTLNDVGPVEGPDPKSLPEGITVALLKSRLEGKNRVKGALLTPKEMEELTECWKPYRSIGVYYMWSLASADA